MSLSLFSPLCGRRKPARVAARAALAALGVPLLLSACAVEFQNRQAAEELARAAQPPGSVYTGWRVFQDRCAACHGPAASGTDKAPDLLPRLRGMGPRRFVDWVLKSYDWQQPLAEAGSATPRERLIDEVMARRQGALAMPAWEGEPRVTAHIADLYAWLAARAEGTQGPGRPAR
jgi:mono/diheme cytochrome c family protein